MDAPQRSFDARELRQALGTFVTGVTIVTTVDAEGKPQGLTANSFSSVSLDPPLILWSQSVTAPSHAVFKDCERFAINILADDQVDISNRFARGGADKFAGIAVSRGLGDVPLIEGAMAHLECRKVHAYPGGDHVVFIGEVERIQRHPRQPLVFGSGRYLVAQPHDLGAPTAENANIARLAAVRLATRSIAELSDELDETLGLGVWGNKGPTIVRWEESKQPVSDNLRTGLVLPVLTSATGLAFAAWLPGDMSAPFIEAELMRGPAGSEAPELLELPLQLARIRDDGCVRLVGTENFADLYGGSISAVSVPVVDAAGAMVLALTAIGARDRLDTSLDGRLIPALQRCAESISQRLRSTARAASE